MACGRRKAWTPSAIASTPVSAVAPDENARRRGRGETASASSGRSAVAAVGQPPRHCTSPDQRHRDDHHEAVRGDREERARLPDAAQVRDRDQGDEADRDRHAYGARAGRRRRDRDRAGRDAHRHREDVVDQDRGGRGEARGSCRGSPSRRCRSRRRADTRGPSGGSRRSRRSSSAAIPSASGDPSENAAAPAMSEDEHHLLRRVRDRGERVRGEDRQRQELRQQLVLGLVRARAPGRRGPASAGRRPRAGARGLRGSRPASGSAIQR